MTDEQATDTAVTSPAASRVGHRAEPDPTDLIELATGLRARAGATRADRPGRIALARILDAAVEALTSGLPDVDCAVSLAALPDLHLDVELDAAATAEARGRLVAWLSGVIQQLTLGRAVVSSVGDRLAAVAARAR